MIKKTGMERSTATKKKVVAKKAASKKQVAAKAPATKPAVAKKAPAVKKAPVTKKAPVAKKKAAAKPANKPVISPRERYEMIATMAYYRAEQRNFAPGNDEQDWFECEQIIDEMLKKR